MNIHYQNFITPDFKTSMAWWMMSPRQREIFASRVYWCCLTWGFLAGYVQDILARGLYRCHKLDLDTIGIPPRDSRVLLRAFWNNGDSTGRCPKMEWIDA